jgi:anti-repressor protein
MTTELKLFSGENTAFPVCARTLHENLGIGRDFNTWIKDKIEKYGFIEDKDYSKFVNDMASPNLGIRKSLEKVKVDYYLTLVAAKTIAAGENNEVSRHVRDQLIALETKITEIQQDDDKFLRKTMTDLQTGMAILNKRIALKDRELVAIANQLAVVAPKGEIYDKIIDARDGILLDSVAKMIGWGRNKFFARLRADGILFKSGSSNRPTQEYVDKGLLIVKWGVSDKGKQIATTLVTSRGVSWLTEKYYREPRKHTAELVLFNSDGTVEYGAPVTTPAISTAIETCADNFSKFADPLKAVMPTPPMQQTLANDYVSRNFENKKKLEPKIKKYLIPATQCTHPRAAVTAGTCGLCGTTLKG